MLLHNELCDGVFDLAIKTFNPTHVHDEPKIYTGWSVCGGKDKLKGSSSNDKGELKGVSSLETSIHRGRTVFTTCVS